MRVPSEASFRAHRARSAAVGAVVVALALAGCSGSTAGSMPVSTHAPSIAAAAPSLMDPASASSLPTEVPSSGGPPDSAAPSQVPSAGPLALVWQKAGSTAIKTETYWPAIDPLTGDIWVASSFESKYWIFKPDGTFVREWGTPGSGPGQLALTTHDPNPDGVGAIAFAPDGTFYVADNGNYRVEKFDKDGGFVRQWGSFGTENGQFVSPKGIATDGKLVYVDDDLGTSGVMSVFDTSGTFLRSFPFLSPLFSLTRDGHLLEIDDQTGAVLVLDSTGQVGARYPVDFGSYGPDAAQAGSPTGAAHVVLEPNGRILVALQNDSGPVGLLELDRTGHVVRHWSTGSETMVLSPDGSAIYMADTGPVLSGWPYIRKYVLPKG